ncbi:PEP-CTERM sorting domain-containing protein [Novosphingobium sp. BW1]|uniref:PEP-CTERM sorting domain-containing protein n=1 Tax=Novosphingobium sp. BW1 TaxID=2592621 RepID=UPI0011DEBF85|nr:PEP-CTERM sorting domain-containing protein [Novosphingobium sp. BW1]TYC90784.1 PEP-CTERM sorting domain-containing protein [Novosphingobium sp. BW1]
MLRKTLNTLAISTALSVAFATPAHATFFWWPTSSGGTHSHYCDCGHSGGSTMCGGSTSTTSGGTTTTSGGTTTTSGGTTTTTSGGTTTTSGGTSGGSSGGTDVPEPGMLGMMGLGLIGLAYARRRKRRLA